MRKLLAILLCKLACLVGKIVKKGSSKPGQLALKICPDIIARIRLPGQVIAVTGSNGKTSTVEMIVQILERAGKTVCWNKEGSNQIEGVATMLIRYATLTGRVKADAVVLESDEQYARHTFKYLKPTHFAVLNLYRDQMTRNGHPEFILNRIRDAVYPSMKLILNGDDPRVATLADRGNPVKWFGIDRDAGVSSEPSVYDDGRVCPVCGRTMEWDYTFRTGFGGFRCTACDFAHRKLDYAVTAADIDKGDLTVNGKTRLHTRLRVLYSFYNMLAAYAVTSELGVDPAIIAEVINDYNFRNGRTRSWTQNGRKITLLTSKHENSASYDQSIDLAIRCGGDVLVIVDAVSRKYFTGETSWLWDIRFDRLASERIGKIFIAGTYVNDIANRLSYAEIDMNRVAVLETLDDVRRVFTETKDLYVITCFSDKEKFLTRLPADAVERSENI